MNRVLFGVVVALIAAQQVVASPNDPNRRSERVQFAAGAESTLIKGQVKGRHYVDYLVRAGAGQTLSVAMKTGNGSNHFNILPPDGGDVAMFVGSMSGERFSGVVPTDGDYGIRVYLMRGAARRNEVARYTLTVGVTGQALAATPAAQDPLISGTPYHASTKVVCTAPFAPKGTECDAFVTRRGFDGTATVEVRWGEGLKRRILFVRHEVVAADSPEAPVFERRSEFTIVRFGDAERFEIPEALVTGG